MGDVLEFMGHHARASAGTSAGWRQRSGRKAAAETRPPVARSTAIESSAEITSAVTNSQEILACEQPISLASFSWLPTNEMARRKCSFHMLRDYQSLGCSSTNNLFEQGYQYVGNLGPMSVAENVRRFRKDRGLSQEDLAKAVGIRQNAIVQLENGKTKKSKYLPQIAVALGCQLNQLDETLPNPGVQIVIQHKDASHQAAYDRGWDDAIRSLVSAAARQKRSA